MTHHSEFFTIGLMEDDPTLASVVAFLDEFDDLDDVDGEEDQALLQQGLSGIPLEHSAAKLSRPVVKYTTKLQRRKRAELSSLREQVRVLEARLEHLRLMTWVEKGKSGANAEVEAWVALEEKAAYELAARQRSEQTNKQLRAHLERQIKLRDKIERLIGKYQRRGDNLDVGRSLLAAAVSSAAMSMPVSTGTMALSIFTNAPSVQETLEQLVAQVDSVFSNTRLHPQSSWLETHAAHNAAEIRTFTMSKCTVAMAADLLWRRPKEKLAFTMIAKNEVPVADGLHGLEKTLLPIQCRPWWDHLDQENSSRIEVVLQTEHFLRRVHDPVTGRSVLVTLALTRLPGDNGQVLLREHFWKSITPVHDSTEGKSIIQTSYVVASGNQRNCELSPSQSSVMKALVQLTRRNHALYQEWLLE